MARQDWAHGLIYAGMSAGLALGAATLTRAVFRRSLPQMNGTVKLPGLSAPVEVVRDRWGVPHIYAWTEKDAWRAMGYVHAQDRLWQMELGRRVVAGRLSEIFGEGTLDTDRFIRTIGLRRASEADVVHLTPELQEILVAYVNGVNAFVQNHLGRLPPEFVLLRLKPEPWTLADSLGWAKFMAWTLSQNWESELLRGALAARLPPEGMRQMAPTYPAENPCILNSADVAAALQRERAARPFLGPSGPGLGSNSWVVDGTKSVTGMPLLANDPHLQIQMPSIWYQAHVVAEDGLAVTGVTLPGVPYVVIGHNQHIAWGYTNGGADVQDLYVERFHPEDPHRVEFRGEWEPVQVVCEEIRVRGWEKPVVEEVRITRHGPILPGMLDHVEQPLALHWLALKQPGTVAEAARRVNWATNWSEFREAERYFDVPGQNAVYADRQGNIGYVLTGKVPIREKGDGTVPVPGWTGEYEWSGFIPYEEMPFAFNPEQHFIATANNKVVDDEYPYYLGQDWAPGYRARRITELLAAKAHLSIEDFRHIQLDQKSYPAVWLAEQLKRLKSGESEHDLRWALAFIRDWDGQVTADSVGAAIVETAQMELLVNVFAPILGDLSEQFLGKGPQDLLSPLSGYVVSNVAILERVWKDRQAWDTLRPGVDRMAMLKLCLQETVDYLRRELGPNMSDWKFGRLRRLTFHHPLGAAKVLAPIFNRGPFPRGGDPFTVNPACTLRQSYDNTFYVGASYRQIVDLGNLSRSVSVIPTGQSGHPLSQHYDDQMKLWLEGEMHPMLWERADVERDAQARLVLEP